MKQISVDLLWYPQVWQGRGAEPCPLDTPPATPLGAVAPEGLSCKAGAQRTQFETSDIISS